MDQWMLAMVLGTGLLNTTCKGTTLAANKDRKRLDLGGIAGRGQKDMVLVASMVDLAKRTQRRRGFIEAKKRSKTEANA